MDIREKLKAYAESKNWKFIHARRDFQNLHGVTDFIYSQTEGLDTGETVLILDPVVRKFERDGILYSGNFLVLTNSPLDMDYEEKYLNYIQPLFGIINNALPNVLRCEYDLNAWQAIELVNQFDFNADGVSVSFSVKGYDFPALPTPIVTAAPTEGSAFYMGRGDYSLEFRTPADNDTELDGAEFVIEVSDSADFTNIIYTTTGIYQSSDFFEGMFYSYTVDSIEIYQNFYYRQKNVKDGVSSEWLELYFVV